MVAVPRGCRSRWSKRAPAIITDLRAKPALTLAGKGQVQRFILPALETDQPIH